MTSYGMLHYETGFFSLSKMPLKCIQIVVCMESVFLFITDCESVGCSVVSDSL